MTRVAVVTGASSGIGQATAIALARNGWAIFAHGNRNQTGMQQTLSQIEDSGRKAAGCCGDLRDETARLQLLEQSWSWCQTLDAESVCAWINLAGIDVLTGEHAELSFDQKLQLLWEVDVAATAKLCRLVGQRMLPSGGSIINVGWDQAAWGMEGDSGQMFAATKAAVTAFSLSLARTLAPKVRVNCVSPGWIQTKWGRGASSDWQNRAIRESLLERWGQPTDVAQAICFLASEEASFINGQVLNVNGGFAGHASPAGEVAGPEV